MKRPESTKREKSFQLIKQALISRGRPRSARVLRAISIREIWRYPCGTYEMRYEDFAREVSRFVSSFLRDMDSQTREVVRKGIPGVYVDKGALIRENSRRREIFSRQLEHLYAEDAGKTDWKRITDLYERMRRETGKRKE